MSNFVSKLSSFKDCKIYANISHFHIYYLLVQNYTHNKFHHLKTRRHCYIHKLPSHKSLKKQATNELHAALSIQQDLKFISKIIAFCL